MSMNLVKSNDDTTKIKLIPDNGSGVPRHSYNIDILSYDNENLIELINEKKQDFFNNIHEDTLKLIKKEVFNKLSKNCIGSLNNDNCEMLAETNIVEFLPDNFLQYIDKEVFIKLSENFIQKITIKQINTSNKNVFKNFIDFKKFNYLNNKKLQAFCKKISFSDLDSKQISFIIKELDTRKKLNYITGKNYTYFEKHIENEELSHFLDKLKKIPYICSDTQNDNSCESILDVNDIKDDDKIIIINSEIPSKIEDFLNSDNYELLKAYCMQCCQNVANKDSMLNTLNSLLKYSKDNIYDLIDEFEIRIILISISNNREINKSHFKRIKQIIKEMQRIELSHPDEFMSKINLFSQIIKKELFKIDFLEMIAEENFKNIKLLLKKYYSGTDENAAPTELKEKHVEIISDYMKIIEKKYKVNKEKILSRLQKIEGENLEQQLNLFVISLNKYEKLYYDLFIQIIYEQPNSKSWIEAHATPIFRIIRDIIFTLIGMKMASLTGSKILIGLTASLGGAYIFKDIKDEIVKSYFSLKEAEKRLYHLNLKNARKKTSYIIKKKIKEEANKIINPIKNFFTKIINTKILNQKEIPKFGFDRDYDENENLEKECEDFKRKVNKIYNKKMKKILRVNFLQKLLKLKKKYEDKNISNKSQINKFFEVKRKIISKEIDNKEKKLKEQYPDFKDQNVFNNILKSIRNAGSLGFCLFKSLTNVITFGLTTNYWNKKNDAENLLETFKNHRYNEFKKKLKACEKERQNSEFYILIDDIKFLAKKNPKDLKIFDEMEKDYKKAKKELEIQQDYFQMNLLKELDFNDKNGKKSINICEEEKNEFIRNESDISRSDLNESLLGSEDNEIINTNSY